MASDVAIMTKQGAAGKNKRMPLTVAQKHKQL
jgi:hypothetical protein